MKNSKLLISIFLTVFFAFCTVSATATISTNNVTPNGNNKLAGFGEVKDGCDMFCTPIRKPIEERFDNIWYASLYGWVKQNIDNGYADPSYRHGEYVKVCRTIAENQDFLRNYGDSILEPWSNQLNLAVREENGVVNCYLRKLSQN